MSSDSKVNMRQLEAEAKKSATQQIINIFARPGQLDKIDQYKRRWSRKKASTEALLKSAMQQQLDGVRTGLNQLHASLGDVVDINVGQKRMYALLAEVPELGGRLAAIRDENMRHSQYVTARENLKHIFTVPESVQKTEQWINEGKLLHTHQCLLDLENSRDDLLYELHKLPNQSPHDKSMLKAYFDDVEVLSTKLEKQLRLILGRTLNTVRKEPTVIVTALRIIEREEKADFEALKQHKQTGFMPPGRPKNWKRMCFEVLEKSVAVKIEGTQVEEREDNKLWLIRYLELIRQTIWEDLRVVKSLATPCFPPSYQIVDRYVKMYHVALCRHLEEIIQNGLEGNEYVTILSWVAQTYHGPEMLGHCDLAETTKDLGPLLPKPVIEGLERDYLANMERNYVEWMRNTLSSEQSEWQSSKDPNSENYVRTAAPIIIFQMIDQNLQVGKTIGAELTVKILVLSVNQVVNFGEAYRKAIYDFKCRYFDNRDQLPFFTQYMITIVNNCLQLTELGSQLERQYSSQNAPVELSDCFNRLRGCFIQLRNSSSEYLLEEMFLDLNKHFDELFTQKWINNAPIVDTICETLKDYFQDYKRLEKNNYQFVVHQTRSLILKKYLTALLSKKMAFKTMDESERGGKQIVSEARKLRKVLDELWTDENSGDVFEVVVLLAEVLKSDDDMLSFELHRLVEQFSDCSDDHLTRLLSLRGDLSRSSIKDKIEHVPRGKPLGHQQGSGVFKTLVFPKPSVNLNVFNN